MRITRSRFSKNTHNHAQQQIQYCLQRGSLEIHQSAWVCTLNHKYLTYIYQLHGVFLCGFRYKLDGLRRLPLCSSDSLDPFGHHFVTCKRGGDVTLRHSTIRGALCTIPSVEFVNLHILKLVEAGVKTAQGLDQQISLVTNWDNGTSCSSC